MARWGAASIVWRKVLDFKSLKDDSGLHVHDATFAFVEDLATRGIRELAAAADRGDPVRGDADARHRRHRDRRGAGTFSDPNAFADFGVDDMPTGQQGVSSGEIREIRVWNAALNPDQISQP
jgi:hypothetical protein